jgi:hypothetical protein
LHVPLSIAVTGIGMATSVAIAVSSPHQAPKQDGWTGLDPAPATLAIPTETVARANAEFSLALQDRPAEVASLLADEVRPVESAASAKAYLAETAGPGGTIVMLGREKSVECFHPQFAINLAAAIRDAREQGFQEVGVLSGCRPPRLGIGGFADKKNSLHGVGLAADIHGIGAPCSEQVKRFHAIAAARGVLGVYGPCNRAEWNHVQGTAIKMTTPELRDTFTAKGDIAPDLQHLWQVAKAVVLDPAKPLEPLAAAFQAAFELRPHAKRVRGHHRRVKNLGIASRQRHLHQGKRRRA